MHDLIPLGPALPALGALTTAEIDATMAYAEAEKALATRQAYGRGLARLRRLVRLQGRHSPASARTSVLLPVPDGPMIAAASPGARERFTSDRIVSGPRGVSYRFVSSLTLRSK